MKVGAFDGTLIFETSDARVLTYTGMKQTAASRWETHEIVSGAPRRELLGADTGALAMDIHLAAACGVSPDREAERWLDAARTGRTGYLVVGGRVIGGGRWSVTSAAVTQTRADADGRTLSAELTVKLEAYT